ncbi:MAG: hypothetical protein AB8H79_17885 [Myxococcota bacterium]
MLILLTLTAFGASETELPPALRADVSVGYELGLTWAGLAEDGLEAEEEVGRRRDMRHELLLGGVFSVVDGVAFTVGAEVVPQQSIEHLQSRTMVADPDTGRGSFLAGEELSEPPVFKGGGLEGVWLGMAFQPFSETFAKKHEVTWRLDVAIRTPPGRTFWEENGDGRRGVGEGGPTYRLAAAFSRDHERSSPYMTADWRLTTPRSVDVSDGAGGDVNLRVRPGHTLDVRGGVEIRLGAPSSGTSRADLDLHTGFGYLSPQSIISGIDLPDVLDASRTKEAVRAERLGWQAGMAFDIEVDTSVELRLWSRAFWALPWRVENGYKVRTTLDTVQGAFGADVRFRIR